MSVTTGPSPRAGSSANIKRARYVEYRPVHRIKDSENEIANGERFTNALRISIRLITPDAKPVTRFHKDVLPLACQYGANWFIQFAKRSPTPVEL